MNIDRAMFVRRVETDVRALFEKDASGHDWNHIQRVRELAERISRAEGADARIVDIAALVHEIGDRKLEFCSNLSAEDILDNAGAPSQVVRKVVEIIDCLGFEGAGSGSSWSGSLEAACVRDADRLDAMGATGIARAFAYGGSRGQAMVDVHRPPRRHHTQSEYRNAHTSTVNHFYEKLLLLRDSMVTAAGQELATRRHLFMERFLEELQQEGALAIGEFESMQSFLRESRAG